MSATSRSPASTTSSQLIPSAVHRFDATWGTNNNFPKLASSDAHLFGKPEFGRKKAAAPASTVNIR